MSEKVKKAKPFSSIIYSNNINEILAASSMARQVNIGSCNNLNMSRKHSAKQFLKRKIQCNDIRASPTPSITPTTTPRPTVRSTPRSSPRFNTPTQNAYRTPSSLFRNVMVRNIPPRSCDRTLQSEQSQSQSQYGQVVVRDNDDRMAVAVRVRPLNAMECMQPNVFNIISSEDTKVNRPAGSNPNGAQELTVSMGNGADGSIGVTHTFSYDHVFYSCNPESPKYASQRDVFLNTAYPLIERSFAGHNACLFAYGQTGSGKSHSMMGSNVCQRVKPLTSTLRSNSLSSSSGSSLASSSSSTVDNTRQCCCEKDMKCGVGIIPRFCLELFRCIASKRDKCKIDVEISYYELYNEKIYDLLVANQGDQQPTTATKASGEVARKALRVREHPTMGPYVVGLSVHPVDNYQALYKWLVIGNSQRATAAAGLNEKSSRSHAIFNIMLQISERAPEIGEARDPNAGPLIRRSKISLVDLAGSERITSSNSDRIREGVHINKSLLTLGKVIAALSEQEKNGSNGSGTPAPFIPYRESVLTWLLKVSASICREREWFRLNRPPLFYYHQQNILQIFNRCFRC